MDQSGTQRAESGEEPGRAFVRRDPQTERRFAEPGLPPKEFSDFGTDRTALQRRCNGQILLLQRPDASASQFGRTAAHPSRKRLPQIIAVPALTSNSSAASRREAPPSTSAIGTVCSLITTAKLNNVKPFAHLEKHAQASIRRPPNEPGAQHDRPGAPRNQP
jgi:hypothetical protein